MEQAKAKPRRRHDTAFKEQVVAECRQPGASVAAVALGHGLNANLVHRWCRLARRGQLVERVQRGEASEFVPIALAAPPMAASIPAPEVRIELRRGATAITVHWPAVAAADCAAWMRELLR